MTYQPIDGGNVLMENNMPCKTIGTGSIKIRTHDGMVRTLSNVAGFEEKFNFFGHP